MSSLIGILVDVSGSMRANIGGHVHEKGGSWARSIFRVVDDLIKHDVSSSNKVFTIGVGAQGISTIFDLLNTIKKVEPSNTTYESGTLQEKLDKILHILETNGAPNVRKWGEMDVLMRAVTDSQASIILHMLHDYSFRQQFIYDCLPSQCRSALESAKNIGSEGLRMGAGFLNIFAPGAKQTFDTMAGTEDAVNEAVEKGLRLAGDVSIVKVGTESVLGVHTGREILHGCIGEADLTDERVDDLMKAIDHFIYARTPMIAALNSARHLFSDPHYGEHSKLLLVLSDGEPTDDGIPPFEDFKLLGISIVCCYITKENISEPKRLYSQLNHQWEEGAQFMFRLSSTITTQVLPRTIFVKRGWQVDITNNETKLFFQVNHPDIIKDVCKLARDVVCCQDALSDLLTTISLDLYINQAKEGFGAKHQEEPETCYANAAAAVMHLAMMRIVGREDGYPDFFDLRKLIIEKYGKLRYDTLAVLEDLCPKYRLRYKEVDVLGACKAITGKRPVLVRFRLTKAEWDVFYDFYERNPRGILSTDVLDITMRTGRDTLWGHAAVLTSYNSECLRLMNSWGTDWADNGFFSIASAKVLGLEFTDVYWTSDDLKHSEKETFDRMGGILSEKLLTSLKGLQEAIYKCPLCKVESKVTDYTGEIVTAKCPKCGGKFDSRKAEDLVLNMYLTSLSR